MIYIGNMLYLSNQQSASEKERRHGEFNLIVEADKRFTRGKLGSNSALGRALIRYGIPTRIDAVGDSTRRDERWETWIYDPSGLKLVFQDPHGLGDFMLVEKNLPQSGAQ